jgi:predicted RNase H-like HicB family nuclease
MKQNLQLTAVIEREGDGFVSLCPEVDVASQGDTIEEARANLVEALELFFKAAGESEIASRLTRLRRDGSPAARPIR